MVKTSEDEAGMWTGCSMDPGWSEMVRRGFKGGVTGCGPAVTVCMTEGKPDTVGTTVTGRPTGGDICTKAAGVITHVD